MPTEKVCEYPMSKQTAKSEFIKKPDKYILHSRDFS